MSTIVIPATLKVADIQAVERLNRKRDERMRKLAEEGWSPGRGWLVEYEPQSSARNWSHYERVAWERMNRPDPMRDDGVLPECAPA